MERQTFIDKIKLMFSEVEDNKEEEVKDKYADMLTIDGSTLRVKGELGEGVEVFIIDEEGKEELAPDGEYLVEGMTIVVAEGKVSSLVEAEEEAPVEEPVVEEELAEEEPVAEPEVEEPKECECKGEEECECDKEEVEEAELAEEVEIEEEVELEEVSSTEELEKRLVALEEALANIAESMSAIDKLSEAVSMLSESPSDVEVKLSKAGNIGGSVSKASSREEKLKFFSKK